MSVIHSDKCDKETAQQLKVKVISLLTERDIDVSKLEIKCLTCYGGDVRVYLGVNERVSNKISFRKTDAKIENGKVVGYFGTKGKHEIKERDYVVFNTEDFESDFGMIDYNIHTIKKYQNDNN